jgi:hypothetical protein
MISPRLALAATVLTVAVAVPSLVAAVSAAPAPVKQTHACSQAHLTRDESKASCTLG